MARLFDDASSEYLRIEQAIPSLPFAWACWFNADAYADYMVLMNMGDKDVTDDHRNLMLYGATKKLGAGSIGTGPVVGIAYSTTTWLTGSWYHACGIHVAPNDRRVLLNAAGKGTNTTSVPVSNEDRTCIGYRGGSSWGGYYMSGHIAEAAIWDLSAWPGATASDKADAFEKTLPSLAKGFSPLFYSLGLKAYWPLTHGLNDKIGGYNLTASGTIVAAQPRIIQPCGVL